MKINQIIIHEIEKEAGKTGAKFNEFNLLLDNNDEKLIKIVLELNSRYKNRIESYAIFDPENSTTFNLEFENYMNNKDYNVFKKFTIESSKDLNSRLDTIAPAKGGFLIFADYELNGHFLGVFFVRNTSGVNFKKNKNDLNIDDVLHIDFENLAMACRVNINGFLKKDIRYLSFINKKSDSISQFFSRWISTVETETNEYDTNLLYNLLKIIQPPFDNETNLPIEQYIFLDNVNKYIRSNGKNVNIKNLSFHFYESETYLIEEFQKRDIRINGEFKAHPRILNKFVYVRAKADNIELSFPNAAYKTLVKIDNDNQIIIKSDSLVEKIKQMVLENEN